jgi:type VI secretion system protein ImpL
VIRILFKLLLHPLLWRILFLAVLCLAIWFIGPLFAFSEWRPFESVIHRVLVIGLILGYLFVKKLISFWHSRRINARFIDALSNKGMSQTSNNMAIDELSRNFTLAMNHLKNTAAGSRSGIFSGFSQRFVYQFPWYVFIGAPGSGKTTALVNSGLQFPLMNSLGRESLKGVGGTRNCDWWFAEEAVFIDTAGRYITHESHSQHDKDEWSGFLGLLKKFRPRQPLNGAVLTISIADLLSGTEQSREKQAAILRARLGELSNSLGINFPVYILLTKADLLGGFSDYFSQLPKEERDQVLGFTFSSCDPNLLDMKSKIRMELDLIAQRLFDGLPDLILQESDVSRRAYSFAFPQNLANSFPLIIELVNNVFTGPDVSGPQVRGIYFTSGTQEGTPFDRVLSALGRRFGVSSNINTHKKSTIGRSYFLKDLITRVVLPEAHLAGKNLQEEKRSLWLGLGAHSVVLVTFCILIAFLAGSYYQNRAYLGAVDQRTILVKESIDQLVKKDKKALVDYLPVLNSLCCLANGEDYSIDSPPLEMTFGLYQGEKVDAAVQRTYKRALQGTLLPLVAGRLQQLLMLSNDKDLDTTYQVLKAYLMLNQPEHYDQVQLLQFIETDFNQLFATELSREQKTAVYFHLHQLFNTEAQLSPFALDEELVQSKRRMLNGFSFSERAYQTIKTELLKKSNLPDISFLSSGGAKSQFVFERISGKALSDGVPGLFTREGYQNEFLPSLRNQLKTIVSEESWVLGSYSSFDSTRQMPSRLLNTEQALLRFYLQDYVGIWDSYLADLRLISTRSMAESIDAARILSAGDSPLYQLIANIAPELSLGKNISLASQAASKELNKRISDRVIGFDQSIKDVSDKIARSDSLESMVDSRFRDIVELTHGANKEPEKVTLLKMFNEIYLSLSNVDFSIRSGARTLDNSDVIAKVRSEAARYPMPVRTILEGLVADVRRQAEGGIRGALNSELDSSVGDFCRIAIRGRYPFDRRSNRDVTLSDFSTLFSPAGLMDSYFNENLRAITDTTGRNWVLRQYTDVQLPIASFQQAARIREVFFPSGSRVPVLNFEYKIIEMDSRISQLSIDFDGQSFQYAHGPQISRSVSWPGPAGANQIYMELIGVNTERKILEVNGPWAIMRLFDLGQNQRLQPEIFLTTLFVNGYKVVFEITANSVNNPFYLTELGDFSCPVSR